MSLSATVRDSETMQWLGRRIGAALASGDLITLDGPLGAGKTTLTRGICEGAAVSAPDTVTSPTFSLVNMYAGPVPIAHCDFYRIEHAEELDELGLWEAQETGAIVIEWAERFVDDLPTDRLAIRINRYPDGHRTLTLLPHGERACALVEQLRADILTLT
jgi:tRNA threonylcarbamoyl adenosine modification protein YjeE